MIHLFFSQTGRAVRSPGRAGGDSCGQAGERRHGLDEQQDEPAEQSGPHSGPSGQSQGDPGQD